MASIAYRPAMLTSNRSALGRMTVLAGCIVASVALGVSGTAPALADSEPTSEECHAKVDEARVSAEALPAEHMSRYFAERYLQQALAEAGNGEFDECMSYAEAAILEVRELRHNYPLGTKLNVLGPNEYPPEVGNKPQSAQGN